MTSVPFLRLKHTGLFTPSARLSHITDAYNGAGSNFQAPVLASLCLNISIEHSFQSVNADARGEHA